MEDPVSKPTGWIKEGDNGGRRDLPQGVKGQEHVNKTDNKLLRLN